MNVGDAACPERGIIFYYERKIDTEKRNDPSYSLFLLFECEDNLQHISTGD